MSNPATDSQLARLRELARDYGLPDEAHAYVERRIARGLTQTSAFKLIQRLGARIHAERERQAAAVSPVARPRDRAGSQPPLTL